MNVIKLASRDTRNPEASRIIERYKQAQQREKLREWHEAMLVFAGRQWDTYNIHTAAVDKAQTPSWRVQLVANLVLPAVVRLHAKMTQGEPILMVLPANNQESSMHAARSSDRLLAHLWRELSTTLKLHALTKWMIITGTSFMKVHWDPTAGTPLPGTNLYTGEVAQTVLSPFELYPEPGARTLDQARWVIHAVARTVDYVRHYYGVDLAAENVTTLPGSEYSGAQLVTVLEYWERPTHAYPGGRVVTVAGGKVLDDKPNPYDHKDFPFVQFDYIKVPGSFWARGAVIDMISLQREYNKGRSQLLEARNLTSQPQWLIPDGSMNPRSITNAPGLRLRYNPNMGKPERVAGPNLPDYVTEDIQRSKRDMDTISGIGEISQSQWPMQVSSGLAVAILREQEDARFLPVVKRYEHQLAKVGELMLKVARQYYTETRVIRVLGQDNRYDVYRLTGNDIDGDYDVVVQPGSALPESRLAKQQYLLDLWNAGILKDRHQVLQMLEFGTLKRLYEDAEIDNQHATREHVRILSGEAVDVEPWHNHAAHISAHNRFRKTAEYETLPESVRSAFVHHVAQHEDFVVAEPVAQHTEGDDLSVPDA